MLLPRFERMRTMKQMGRLMGAIAVMATILSGCGDMDNRNADTGIDTDTDRVSQETEKDEPFFPSSYTGGTDKITFDCKLEVPEGFDPWNFYMPEVNGLQCIDQEEAYKIRVGEHTVKDKIEYPKEETGDITDRYYYFLDDGTIIGIDSGYYFHIENDLNSSYTRTSPINEFGTSKEQFSFGSAEDCIEQIKEELAQMSYPVGELKFDWFSVNKKEYEELEKQYIESGLIEPEKKRDAWTDEDNIYEIYAWQEYGGLQVFQQYMTVHLKNAFEEYSKAAVTARYSENGLLSLIASAPYAFEATDEKAVFLPFPEIASRVEKKYDNLLDEKVYTVKRAKLALRVYYDKKQEYAAEPVWYFEVEDNDGKTVVFIINAITGNEIQHI